MHCAITVVRRYRSNYRALDILLCTSGEPRLSEAPHILDSKQHDGDVGCLEYRVRTSRTMR